MHLHFMKVALPCYGMKNFSASDSHNELQNVLRHLISFIIYLYKKAFTYIEVIYDDFHIMTLYNKNTLQFPYYELYFQLPTNVKNSHSKINICDLKKFCRTTCDYIAWQNKINFTTDGSDRLL